MATSIGSLAVMITGNSAGLTRELKKAEGDVQGFAGRIGTAGAGLVAGLTDGLGSALKMGLSAMTSPGSLLTGIFGGLGLGALVTESVKLAAEVEDTQASFKVLLGDAGKAASLFADIRNMANTTPLTSKGLSNVAQGLVGAGIMQEQIVPTLRVLGDLAQGDEEKLKGLALAYMQVRAKGKLAAEELNQFAERQVPLRPALAKVMNTNEAALADLIERGKVGFPELQRAMVALTGEGGRFLNLMNERAKTFNGLTSSLIDNVQTLGGNLGQAIIEEFNLKPLVEKFALFAQEGGDNIDKLRPILRNLKDAVVDFGNASLDVLANVGGGAIEFGESLVAQLREIKKYKDEFMGVRDWLAKYANITLGQGPEWTRYLGPGGGFHMSKRLADQLDTPGRSQDGQSLAEQFRQGVIQAKTAFNSSLIELKAGASLNGSDIGKALGQGIKEGLKIEMKQLNPDQLKFEQGLRDRMSPVEVFRKRIRDINEQNDIAPLGAAKHLAVKEAWDDLKKGVQQSGQQFVSAMAKGSTEAYSFGLRERYSTGQQSIIQIWMQILEQVKKQAELNGKIYDQLQKAGLLEVR